MHGDGKQMGDAKGGGGVRNGNGMLMSTGFPFGETDMIWNSVKVVVAQHCE